MMSSGPHKCYGIIEDQINLKENIHNCLDKIVPAGGLAAFGTYTRLALEGLDICL